MYMFACAKAPALLALPRIYPIATHRDAYTLRALRFDEAYTIVGIYIINNAEREADPAL